ncbi:hypothetical protein D1007_31019 [Hordeum vulgare]|nr:hypothetical protein D1007_31019 [Hordeum vulgare]
MAPAGKQKPETHGRAPSPPLLECSLSKDVDLIAVLPWTMAESREHGRTLIWHGAIAKWHMSKAVYPFFLHSVFAGLVLPFSSFFTAVLNHYGIHTLHLQPNSILLLSVFAFYFEAFVGVRPSVALFRHFFSLHLQDDAHLSACVSFMVAQSDNLLLKARKKVENFRHRWVLMSFNDANPRLEEPKGLPEKTSAWSSAKLSDPRDTPILERFSRDISAKRLTSGMIIGGDKLRLWSEDLSTEELNRVVATLLGDDPGDLPEAVFPLYRLDDQGDLTSVLPVFDERGLLPVEGSYDTSDWEDSQKTVDDCPASAPPPSRAALLRKLEDDNVASEVSTVISPRPSRIPRGSASAPRATRSACVLASRKHGDESPLVHPASAGGKSEAPGSPPTSGDLPSLPSLGRRGR